MTYIQKSVTRLMSLSNENKCQGLSGSVRVCQGLSGNVRVVSVFISGLVKPYKGAEFGRFEFSPGVTMGARAKCQYPG